jgi:hypothetical protein
MDRVPRAKSNQSVFAMVVLLACDLQEAIVIKSRVCSDAVMKTAYISFAAASLVFVLMLLLTSLHP